MRAAPPYKIGNIARLEIELENPQEVEINNIFIEMEVFDSGYKVKSPIYSIKPKEEITIDLFWDTRFTTEKDYNIILLFKNSLGDESKKTFTAEVRNESISFVEL